MARSLEDIKVLVVEDDYLISQLLVDTLTSAGCVVLGPIPRVATALDTIAKETCDVAVLDINLAGELVYPVADILSEREIPFLFVTGYSANMLPCKYAKALLIEKPFKIDQLIGGLSNLL